MIPLSMIFSGLFLMLAGLSISLYPDLRWKNKQRLRKWLGMKEEVKPIDPQRRPILESIYFVSIGLIIVLSGMSQLK